MSGKASKRSRDTNQLAKPMVDIAGSEPEKGSDDGKNAAAVALGRRGGLKGGLARAKKLSPERRKEIAEKAAQARWAKSRDE
ncbi:MAG: histone H1 [Pseudomonadota bacterium]